MMELGNSVEGPFRRSIHNLWGSTSKSITDEISTSVYHSVWNSTTILVWGSVLNLKSHGIR